MASQRLKKLHSPRRRNVKGFQTLLDAWITSGAFQDVNPPAPEAEIKAAETKIGATLPHPLRLVYRCCDGAWMLFYLDFYSLEPREHNWGLVHANEKYIEWGWHIPQEIRLFADEAASDAFGIWLGDCGNPIYNHPIIEVGSMPGEDGFMGLVATNLLSFLRGRSAYYLVSDERDKLEEGGEELSRIQTALDMLKVPQSLRGEHFDDEIAPFRKWADPQLPDPYGDSYTQRYTIADLKKLLGAT